MSDTNNNLRAVLGWAARHAAPGTVLAEEVAEAELELAELRAAPRAATEPRTFDDDETWDWGIVIDALVEHRASAEARKAGNSESNSDVRADICKRMIEAIVAGVVAPRAATEPDPRIWDDGYARGFATAQNIAAATEPLTRERLAAALRLAHTTARNHGHCTWSSDHYAQADGILAALHGAEPAPSSVPLEEPRA